MMKFNPRRPYREDCPEGYMESDRDYVENNLELAVLLLDHHQSMVETLKALAQYEGSSLVRHLTAKALPDEFKQGVT